MNPYIEDVYNLITVNKSSAFFKSHFLLHNKSNFLFIIEIHFEDKLLLLFLLIILFNDRNINIIIKAKAMDSILRCIFSIGIL